MKSIGIWKRLNLKIEYMNDSNPYAAYLLALIIVQRDFIRDFVDNRNIGLIQFR